MELLKRVLLARPEVQGAFIATVNTLTIFEVLTISETQLAAANLALVAWFGLAAKVAFKADIASMV